MGARISDYHVKDGFFIQVRAILASGRSPLTSQPRLGLRLLILGESHYPWEGMPPIHLTTIAAFKPSYRFRKAISNLFDQGQNFWDDVIFYNFVQELVPVGARHRPDESMWESNATVNGFKEVCQVHKPERILVLGKGTWQNLPGNEHYPKSVPQKEPLFPLRGERFSRGLHPSDQFAYWYPTSSKSYALCAPIFHPAYPAGFYLPDTKRTVQLLMRNAWIPPISIVSEQHGVG